MAGLGLSVDRWRPSWSEEQRRAATASAIPNAKIRAAARCAGRHRRL
jgi:P2-related tail formation protein